MNAIYLQTRNRLTDLENEFMFARGEGWGEGIVKEFGIGMYTLPSPTQSLSHVQLFVTPWTVLCPAPLSMKFSRQEHCSGLSFPSPSSFPSDPGIAPRSPKLQANSLPSEPPGKPNIYTLLYLKMDYQQSLTVQLIEICLMLCGSLDGKGVQRIIDTCTCMAESLCCPPETITTLLICYIPIQNKQL